MNRVYSNCYHEKITTLENKLEVLENENKRLKQEADSLIRAIDCFSRETRYKEATCEKEVSKKDDDILAEKSEIITQEKYLNVTERKQKIKVKKRKNNKKSSTENQANNNIINYEHNQDCDNNKNKTYDQNLFNKRNEEVDTSSLLSSPKETHMTFDTQINEPNFSDNQTEHLNKNIIPGNRSFSSITKYGKKVCVIGDSHISRIKKKLFKNSLVNGNSYFNVFTGVTTQRLSHHAIPTMHEDHPDVVVIHIGSNDVTKQEFDGIDEETINQKTRTLTDNIINIGKNFIRNGATEVLISSILPKKNIKLTRVIRRVNDLLKESCIMNNFGYICHDNILRNHIFEDGIHLTDLGTIIFAGNLVDHLNYFVLNKFSNR